MFKIFFTTFFIAELIIAMSLVIKICEYNKCVKNWNNLILKNREQIKNGMTNLRSSLKEFSDNIFKIKKVFKQKQNEYLFNFFKTLVIYLGIFTLRGKYKKAILTYQLVKEIYEGVLEAEA